VGGLIGMSETARKLYGPVLKLVDASPYQPGTMLHEAFRDHLAWLRKEHQDRDHGVTGWGRAKIKRVKTLMDRHADELERLVGCAAGTVSDTTSGRFATSTAG